MNFKCFFDNWFTSVPLIVYLAKKRIRSQGTVRANRVPGKAILSNAEMRKMGQPAIVKKMAFIDDIELSAVSWFDNKTVNLLSSYVGGSLPIQQTSRFFTKEK